MRKNFYLPWVVLFAPAMSVGALIMSYRSVVPEASWLWATCAVFLLFWMIRLRWRVIAWLMMGFCVGVGAMHLNMLSWQDQSIPDLWWHQSFNADVLIDGIAKPVTGGWQCDITTLSAPVNALTHITLQAYWAGDTAPIAGEVWSVRLKLHPNHGQMNPGGFDYEGYLFGKNIIGKAQILTHESIPKHAIWHWQSWRWHIFSHLVSALPDSEFRGLNIALLMGEASLISQEQWQVLRQTGTLHLAVVSGMHLTLVGALAGVLSLWIWRLFPSERFSAILVSAWVAWITATLFALLAGLNLPVQRAWIMVTVVLISILLKRHLHPLLSVSWALLLVMLWDITAVMQAGFWLSFLATSALVWLINSPEQWLWKWIGFQLGMSFLLAPFLMILFQQIPIYAPFANMMASPVIELLLIPVLLFGGLFSIVSNDVSQFVGHLVDDVWHYLWAGLVLISNQPSAVILVKVSGWHWAMLIVWSVVIVVWKRHLLTFVGVLWLAVPSVLFPLWSGSDDNTWDRWHHRLIALDMGQEQPVIIWQSDHGSWLLGTGSVIGSQHSMNTIILPALIDLGIHKLSGVWVWQEDEASKQGIALLTQQVTVETVHHHQSCHPHNEWQWQMIGSTCWLSLPIPDGRLWITPDRPQRLPPLTRQDVVFADRPTDQSVKLEGNVRIWMSQTSAVPNKWAVQRAVSSQEGALYAVISAQTVHLTTERQGGRFYQKERLIQ